MASVECETLLLDEDTAPIIMECECAEFQPILKDFVKYYAEHKNEPVQGWLSGKLREYLPDKSTEDIQCFSEEIISALEISETKKFSLSEAIRNGRSKESWFASEMKGATSAMSAEQASQYLSNLDQALQSANDSLRRTITTQAGTISRNPSLDGFIAEQYHAQTFNLNAEATGSPYRAKVLEPTGHGYAKNSVDIVIVDADGKIVRRYQSKYCKDARATELAFEHGGNYPGQQKLVPEGQEAEITKRVSTVIEAPDGTTSKPLSKANAERMRDEAQSGNWNDLNWNEYKAKDLAIGIGKQAGYAALQGAAISVGFDVATKLWNGEEIEGKEVVKTAVKGGADFGVKAAAAGAIKVGSEKGILSVVPKGTPASTISNIAFVAVEDVKVVGKMATGELSFKEGVEKLEQTTVSTAAGLAAMGKGAAVGSAIGAVLGPAGTAIGGFIGGTIGYMAGSKVGETVVKAAQKVRDKVGEVITSIGSTIRNTASNLVSGLLGIFGF